MNVFEVVKQNVTVRQAAELYGFKPNRSGLIRCIFHNDGTPSMKVDRRYYCFGCGCTGDVIDFTAQLFGLKSREAALKLADDFWDLLWEQGKGFSQKWEKVSGERKREGSRNRLENRMMPDLQKQYLDYRTLLLEWKRMLCTKNTRGRVDGICTH